MGKIMGKIIAGIFLIIMVMIGGFLALCGGIYLIGGLGAGISGEELIIGLPLLLLGGMILKAFLFPSKNQGKKTELEEKKSLTENDLHKK